jgi:hypothetical protein
MAANLAGEIKELYDTRDFWEAPLLLALIATAIPTEPVSTH